MSPPAVLDRAHSPSAVTALGLSVFYMLVFFFPNLINKDSLFSFFSVLIPNETSVLSYSCWLSIFTFVCLPPRFSLACLFLLISKSSLCIPGIKLYSEKHVKKYVFLVFLSLNFLYSSLYRSKCQMITSDLPSFPSWFLGSIFSLRIPKPR